MPNAPCDRERSQDGLRYGIQPSGDGAGEDCYQRSSRPADALRHHGVGARESRLGAGTGGAGGDDEELHCRERKNCPRPREYQKRYNGLVERYETAKSRFDEVAEAIAERSAKSERLAGFIKTLRAQKELLAEFDERLWGCMVDYVTVGADGGMTVVFRDGTGMRG